MRRCVRLIGPAQSTTLEAPFGASSLLCKIASVSSFEERYQPLLKRRVPRGDVALGRAYVIHARNGGVGVAVDDDGCLGYRLHREKLGNHFLFVELDWDEGPPFGTAIPLAAIDDVPPLDEGELLAWLAAQEEVHRAAIDAAWDMIFGRLPHGA